MDEREREELRALARERGLDPEAVLAALGLGGEGLPEDVAALLAEVAGRLDRKGGPPEGGEG